jgi:RND superfamily putative drug exporter
VLSGRPIGVRHPKLTLAAALAVLVVLAGLGSGVDGKLKPVSLTVPGTESARADGLLREHFGDSSPFAILLQGPSAAIEDQGPRLIAVLRRDPRASTISPWDRGIGLAGLRPDRRTALVLADFHVSPDTAMEKTVPRLERLVARTVRPPLVARTAGFATLARAIREESVAVTRRGEEILAPLLLVVLLLVFRSPVAAAVPVMFGATTVIAVRGLVSLLSGFIEVNAFALSIATMIGLALGVDYALLIVSRFREELAGSGDPAAAATITRSTAGRTTAFAGGILISAILIAVFLVPGALLLSFCATVAPAIVVAIAGPWTVGPAILVTLGRGIDRWRIGGRAGGGTRWLAASRFALRRPGLAAAALGLLIVVVAFPATSLATGSVTIEQLPEGDPTRADIEAIEVAVGAGWISPSVVVAVDREGPITTRGRLADLARWQAAVGSDPGVEAVIGPGPLVGRVAPLRRLTDRFLERGEKGGRSGITARLSHAVDVLGRLRRGLGAASEGATAIALGSDRAEEGAGALAGGLSLASSGGHRARQALGRFRTGAHLLAGGERSLALGMSVLDFTVAELKSELGHAGLPGAGRMRRDLSATIDEVPAAEAAARETLDQLTIAWREVSEMGAQGREDARYQPLAGAVREALRAASGRDPVSGAAYVPGYEGLPEAVAGMGKGLRESAEAIDSLEGQLAQVDGSAGYLQTLVRRLRRGIDRVREGSARLAGGSDQIVRGADRLGSGLTRLAEGAHRLAMGLGRLHDGSARLGRGLSSAFHRSLPLLIGARRTEVRVVSGRQRLQRTSPGIFDSGYFVLSALDGAPRESRRLAAESIDLARGGGAAKMLVIGADDGPHHPDVIAAYDRLRERADQLARRTGMQVAVTGGIAQSTDYERATSARLLPLVIAITLVTFLAMLVVLRALPLALLAIGLNLLVVAAAFGVLELLTGLPQSLPFGGGHHLDPVAAAGIFGVVFGLSMDYSVFLLMRIREAWVRGEGNAAAIAFGLERTAGVITGAATIMAIVFMVLATAPVQSVAQFGVSLTVVVLLDAAVVRLMLLPALMKLAGPRVWWLPRWLERRLPRLDVHGEGGGREDWRSPRAAPKM